ncbi:MAG: hypothetical protein [Bacteriophage sp.]|nr:MAG: hypothetical protein [Bacteriophage sp.]
MAVVVTVLPVLPGSVTNLNRVITMKSLSDYKCESPAEALEAFEVAVRAQEMRSAELEYLGKSGFDVDAVRNNYEGSRAELLTWLS